MNEDLLGRIDVVKGAVIAIHDPLQLRRQLLAGQRLLLIAVPTLLRMSFVRRRLLAPDHDRASIIKLSVEARSMTVCVPSGIVT